MMKQLDNRYKKPTTKQTEARTRNWHIRQLRAFFHLVPPPVPLESRIKIQQLIDEQIVALGAESELQRQMKRDRELIDEV